MKDNIYTDRERGAVSPSFLFLGNLHISQITYDAKQY